MATDIDDNISDFGDLTSVEMFQQIADNLNYLIGSTPVGEISYMLVGVTGVSLDPTVWQECDGSLITEPLSPLVGQSTRDLRDLYLRATTGGGVGTTGGSHTIDITHNHGGVTRQVDPVPNTADFSHGEYIVVSHTHTISSYLTGLGAELNPAIFNIEPPNMRVKAYMKIR